jgi:hypothetical protein
MSDSVDELAILHGDASIKSEEGTTETAASSSDDSEIQARPAYHKKAKGTPLYVSRKGDADKRHTKGERTPAQIAAWEKATATRLANREKRMAAAIAAENAIKEEHRAATEEKIVKKAISIKKREIMKQKVIDTISDDETPIEQVRETVKKARAPRVYKEQPVVQREPAYVFL